LEVQLLVIVVSRDDLVTEGTYCELINRGSIHGRRREISSSLPREDGR